MSREIMTDFNALTEFLKNYALSRNFTQDEFQREMQPWHKKLFSFLVFDAELAQINDQSLLSGDGINYMAECCSDLAQALFCWTHGAYKPTAMLLRSSIETFVKACACKEFPSILLESRVFRIMDDASNAEFFSGRAAPLFERIRNEYGLLCSVVHSATVRDFAHIGALRHFPTYSSQVAKPLARQACIILDRMLGVLLANGRTVIPRFHYKNRQSFLTGISPTIKGAILQSEV